MISFKIVAFWPKILFNKTHRQRNSITELTLLHLLFIYKSRLQRFENCHSIHATVSSRRKQCQVYRVSGGKHLCFNLLWQIEIFKLDLVWGWFRNPKMRKFLALQPFFLWITYCPLQNNKQTSKFSGNF